LDQHTEKQTNIHQRRI